MRKVREELGGINMEEFANYVFNEEDFIKKMEIVYYLQKRTGIFFDNSVILKAELAKLFMEKMELDVDKNLVLTACLLYNCKKVDTPKNFEDFKKFPKLSSDYLKSLGFDKKFCEICEGQSRYSTLETRSKESEVIELVEQFGGMILHRPERIAFSVEDAMCLLEFRNLKNRENRYLEKFKEFIVEMEGVKI